jgi:hypothetical protein
LKISTIQISYILCSFDPQKTFQICFRCSTGEAFDAVRKAASDVIDKAANKNDPAIKDMKKKLDKLNNLWVQIKGATKDRSDSLRDALTLAENFWSALQQVLSSIKDIETNLVSQEPPSVEPVEIKAQTLSKNKTFDLKKNKDL